MTPVMMLRSRLGLEAVEQTKDTRIVIVRTLGKAIGLIVDAVEGVSRVSGEHIEAPSELISSEESEHLRGIARTEETLLLILDLEKVLKLYSATPATPEPAGVGAY